MSLNQPDRVNFVQQKKLRKKGMKKPKTTEGKVMLLKKDLSKLKQKMGSPERKNLYSKQAALSVDSNGAIGTPINSAIAQGVGVDGRVGRDVKCSGIDFRYHVYASVATVNSTIRVIVFIDKDNSNTANTDLWYSGAGFTLGTSLAPASYYNRNNRGTFTILYDKLHEFDLTTGSLQQWEHVNLRTDHITRFIDNSTTITENAVRVAFISDKPAGGGQLPIIEYVASYYFTDI